jgi:BirA family biotin operon repressor/biotin-[acetyl-CoA-carboxylase] ligase
MSFPKSSPLASRFDWVATTGSTNTDLLASAKAQTSDFGHFSVLVAAEQTAGRGRSGREWQAPAGSSLFVSVLLRPGTVPATQFAWLPLIAGLAMSNAVSQFAASQRATVKWPVALPIELEARAGETAQRVPRIADFHWQAATMVCSATVQFRWLNSGYSPKPRRFR